MSGEKPPPAPPAGLPRLDPDVPAAERGDAPRSARVVVDGEEYVVLSLPHADGAEAALTDAEREVVALVLAGHGNAEIAAARETSDRTVANQLASIYRKLNVSSRAELAARFAGGDAPQAPSPSMARR